MNRVASAQQARFLKTVSVPQVSLKWSIFLLSLLCCFRVLCKWLSTMTGHMPLTLCCTVVASALCGKDSSGAQLNCNTGGSGVNGICLPNTILTDNQDCSATGMVTVV